MTPLDPTLKEWSERIRYIRSHHDLTQEEFGRIMGVTGKTISNWERGLTLPPTRYRAQLWRRYGQAQEEEEAANGAAV